MFLFNKHCWNSWISIWKTWILTLYCAPKCIIDLNIKTQIVKLLEEKAENLFDPGVDRNVLEKKCMTQKSLNYLKNDKLNFMKTHFLNS